MRNAFAIICIAIVGMLFLIEAKKEKNDLRCEAKKTGSFTLGSRCRFALMLVFFLKLFRLGMHAVSILEIYLD